MQFCTNDIAAAFTHSPGGWSFDAALAEDIVHDTFIKARTSLASLKKEDEKPTSGISTGTASSSSSRLFPPLSFGASKAVLYQTLDDVHLVMNKKSPFSVFAADPNEVGTISNGNADSYIKRYPLVVVFSAELKPKERK